MSSRPEVRGFWIVTGPAEPHIGGAAVTLTGAAAQAVVTVEGEVVLRAPPTLFLWAAVRDLGQTVAGGVIRAVDRKAAGAGKVSQGLVVEEQSQNYLCQLVI